MIDVQAVLDRHAVRNLGERGEWCITCGWVHDRSSKQHDETMALVRALIKVDQERRALRESVMRYGYHSFGCLRYGGDFQACDCGWGETLRDILRTPLYPIGPMTEP